MCGCILGIRTPATAASPRSRRVAACRSIRTLRLSRIGPATRSPTARSSARPTAGGRGTSTIFVLHRSVPQSERVKPAVAAPAEKDLKIRTGVGAGQALVPGQVGRDRDPEQIIRRRARGDRTGHTPTMPRGESGLVSLTVSSCSLRWRSTNATESATCGIADGCAVVVTRAPDQGRPSHPLPPAPDPSHGDRQIEAVMCSLDLLVPHR